MDITSTVTLNNGTEMPRLGLGTWRSAEGEEAEQAVRWALEAGYRHIDTAAIYQNERSVGRAVRASGIPRRQLFITTKLWNSDVRAGRVEQAFEQSLDRLGMDYVDLYLMHWPVPGHYKAAWSAMQAIYATGRARAIGVSNFLVHHLEDLLADCSVRPAVNQCEWHPYLQQPELVAFCRAQQIQFESWSPLMRGQVGQVETIQRIAQRHGRTAAQVVIRWNLQQDIVVIPKSVHRDRIVENALVFDFELTEQDMAELAALDRGQRLGPDPDKVDF